MTPKTFARMHRAFTLIELLAVMAIIAVMASLIVPAFNSLGGAYSLTATAQSVTNRLSLARQQAIARNKSVEVRIYQNDEGAFSTLAVVVPDGQDPGGQLPEEWLNNYYEVPESIVFDLSEQRKFSSLLEPGSANEAPAERTELSSAPEALQGRDYLVFHFAPDGNTNLSATDDAGDPTLYTLSLRTRTASGAGTERPADNFVTLILDPVVGRVRTFQP